EHSNYSHGLVLQNVGRRFSLSHPMGEGQGEGSGIQKSVPRIRSTSFFFAALCKKFPVTFPSCPRDRRSPPQFCRSLVLQPRNAFRRTRRLSSRPARCSCRNIFAP